MVGRAVSRQPYRLDTVRPAMTTIARAGWDAHWTHLDPPDRGHRANATQANGPGATRPPDHRTTGPPDRDPRDTGHRATGPPGHRPSPSPHPPDTHHGLLHPRLLHP